MPPAAILQQQQVDSYPIMFASNEEPVYIPPMRPLTPLSNYHHPHHPHHSVESHYVQYPIQNYGTTPRRSTVNGDKLRNDRSMLNRNGMGGSSGGGGSGDDHDPEREASPAASVGLYKRKGHLNERAFSYSIRQEHRSLSNSLANLQFDDVHINGTPVERRSSSNNSEQLQSQQLHQPNGRLGLSQQHSINSGSEVHDHKGDGRKNSFNVDDHRQPPPHLPGLSQSMANLNINGYPSSSIKDIPKTASIKRASKQRTSLGNRGGLPVAPPVLPIQTNMVKNGS